MKILKYFYGSSFVTLIGVAIAVFIYPTASLETIYSILILAILEISLSFDNAVINAKILGQMPQKWQKIFIYLGLPIAVFGMRLIFLILLVSVTCGINFASVVMLALDNPQQYQKILEHSMPYICSFLSENKGHYWIPLIENNIITKKFVIMMVVTFFLWLSLELSQSTMLTRTIKVV